MVTRSSYEMLRPSHVKLTANQVVTHKLACPHSCVAYTRTKIALKIPSRAEWSNVNLFLWIVCMICFKHNRIIWLLSQNKVVFLLPVSFLQHIHLYLIKTFYSPGCEITVLLLHPAAPGSDRQPKCT